MRHVPPRMTWLYGCICAWVWLTCLGDRVSKLNKNILRYMTHNVAAHDGYVTDIGHATVCGPPGAKIDFSWSPKVFISGSNDTLHLNLNMKAPESLKQGRLDLNVTDTRDEKVPIYTNSMVGNCEDLKKFGFKNITCPIQKLETLNALYTTKGIPNFPAGTFKVFITIINEYRKLFACLKIEVTIKNRNL